LIWSRDESRPTRYGGVLFRSALEAKVAEELDALQVPWEYERPAERTVQLADGHDVAYLPDFTLGPCGRDEELKLPVWLEVKPAGLLYALRDHVGCPERFEGLFSVETTAQELRAAGLEEIWKPKRLAELSGLAVLVASAINRNRMLCALLLPSGVTLSKSHPLVNHKQVVLNRLKEEREALWRAEMERQRAEREEAEQQWRQQAIKKARRNHRPARYEGWCRICNERQPANALVIFLEEGRWLPLCRNHLKSSERGADG
jgi:hypothetical protein